MEKFNYTFDALNALTVKELISIAAELKITGRTKMKKADLIESILNMQNSTTAEDVENSVENVENTSNGGITVDGVRLISDPHNETKRTRESYINTVEVGMIIVFPITETKALTAKVISIKRDSSGNIKEVSAVSNRGSKFEIESKRIIWIKTRNKFPQWVRKLLRGSDAVDGKGNAKGNRLK